MTAHEYDVIVVGVGGIGSAATYHLARRGVDVLGIERYDIPHTMGSSHGSTRIIRKVYHENPEYVSLVERAYELWRDLDAGHDQDLLHTTGSLTGGPPDSDLVANAREACEIHDLDYDTYDTTGLADRFPGYDLPADYEAVYQPDGGFVWPEQGIVAHVNGTHRQGSTIHAREQVTDWTDTSSGVRVETTRETYTAEKLVIAAGAWAPKLLPTFADVLEPERQVAGWFQPATPEAFAPDSFPVFVIDHERENPYYGLPQFHVPGLKVGLHYHFGEAIDPDEMARDPRRRDEDVIREFLADCLPDANGPPMTLSTCIYTTTPDKDFVVDHHPDHDNVVVACGFSGHGFKFAPAVGEILAELALDGETGHPIDLFRADRF